MPFNFCLKKNILFRLRKYIFRPKISRQKHFIFSFKKPYDSTRLGAIFFVSFFYIAKFAIQNFAGTFCVQLLWKEVRRKTFYNVLPFASIFLVDEDTLSAEFTLIENVAMLFATFSVWIFLPFHNSRFELWSLSLKGFQRHHWQKNVWFKRFESVFKSLFAGALNNTS